MSTRVPHPRKASWLRAPLASLMKQKHRPHPRYTKNLVPKVSRCVVIELYEQEKIAAHEDPRQGIANEIETGRTLFRTRVHPKWFDVFDREVVAYPFRRASCFSRLRLRGGVIWRDSLCSASAQRPSEHRLYLLVLHRVSRIETKRYFVAFIFALATNDMTR